MLRKKHDHALASITLAAPVIECLCFLPFCIKLLGLVIWFARTITDPVGRCAILLGGLIGDVVGLCVALMGQLHGVTNALGWSTVAIYGLFALGFAYFQYGARSKPAV